MQFSNKKKETKIDSTFPEKSNKVYRAHVRNINPISWTRCSFVEACPNDGCSSILQARSQEESCVLVKLAGPRNGETAGAPRKPTRLWFTLYGGPPLGRPGVPFCSRVLFVSQCMTVNSRVAFDWHVINATAVASRQHQVQRTSFFH